ncbi:PREDICTED: uncharacterized protein LOC109479337 [Branchiostoma belcheri]|uniref:Uncharacterized protein LOC109479337 n=1 Tax=Branchiostoma belcheri TaxID=7741 RepID=A0A6P5A0X3_BRABE|nr:PREDICTED: uncharacterized protein LOC109479337 [Branchiostoma belcheri]
MNKTPDVDSTSGSGHGIPDNTEATDTDATHICDSATDPVDQQDIQPHCVPTRPQERSDTSPSHMKDPLQNLHSDASAGHSDQDERPAGDYGAERSGLPTVCTSYTDIGKTEQNQALYNSTEEPTVEPTVYSLDPRLDQAEQEQALYVGNPHVEAEELSPEDIYNTEGYNADNAVQYQQSDCRKQASATVYQCSGDSDVANVDRPRVETDDANGEEKDSDKCEARSEPVVTPLTDVENSDQNKSEDKGNADDEYIRPYAVANQRYGHTNGGGDGDFDIQPYAVAYDEQEGHYENDTPTGRSVCGQLTAGSVTVGSNQVGLLPNPMYSGNALQPNPMYSGNALQPNPMYSGNGLRSNPMYAPNVAQPRAGGGCRCVVTRSCLAGVITTCVVVATLAVLAALLLATFMTGEQTWADRSVTGKPTQDVTQYADRPTSPQTKDDENEDLKQTRIVFGGEGEEPGQFSYPSAVIVSPSNELFVADFHNRRVQVFSMRGVYLRHFSAVVGEGFGTIEPEDIAIDGEGHLWVYGNTDDLLDTGYIIRYTKTGHRLTTLHPTFANNSFCGVAVDSRRRLVVATEFWADYGEVKLLHFNGSVLRRFRVQHSSGYPGLVAVGREGNLFVCDHWGDTRVHVYNNTGHYLFSFGGEEISKLGGDQGRTVGGARVVATGVCTDGSGNVLVAVGAGGNVEKFTEDGRYVRRVVSGRFRADSVAVAPGGQLVVADSENSTVTIFSHY